MRTKYEILLNLAKNGWGLRTEWIRDENHIVLYIEVRSKYRNERIYTASYKEDLYSLSFDKDTIDYRINYMELSLLNKLYDKMLKEQGTKVL